MFLGVAFLYQHFSPQSRILGTCGGPATRWCPRSRTSSCGRHASIPAFVVGSARLIRLSEASREQLLCGFAVLPGQEAGAGASVRRAKCSSVARTTDAGVHGRLGDPRQGGRRRRLGLSIGPLSQEGNPTRPLRRSSVPLTSVHHCPFPRRHHSPLPRLKSTERSCVTFSSRCLGARHSFAPRFGFRLHRGSAGSMGSSSTTSTKAAPTLVASGAHHENSRRPAIRHPQHHEIRNVGGQQSCSPRSCSQGSFEGDIAVSTESRPTETALLQGRDALHAGHPEGDRSPCLWRPCTSGTSVF